MKLPEFFDLVPALRVRDPLASLLGSAEDGILEYGFSDAVRLTGHACPTVAAAYWLTWLALKRLYPDSLPERGGIKVEFREDARSGSTGVAAAVIQMLTGAAGGSGFKGISGRFARAGLIRYSPDLLLSFRFTRLDTRAAVDAAADLSLAPPDPATEPLLLRCVRGDASAEEQRRFRALWQERIRHLLLDLGRDPGVFMVRPAAQGPAGGSSPVPFGGHTQGGVTGPRAMVDGSVARHSPPTRGGHWPEGNGEIRTSLLSKT